MGYLLDMLKIMQAKIYRIYVPGTNTVNTTRNVQWMKKMHYKVPVQEPVGMVDSIELITGAGKVGRVVGNEAN